MATARRSGTTTPRVRLLRSPRGLGAITKLAVPAGPGLPSPQGAARALAIAETVRVQVRKRIVGASATGRIDRMLDAIDAASADCVSLFEDALQAALVANLGQRAEMDRVECRRGCAFCCHVDVAVTPLEAIRLARHERAAGRRETAPATPSPRPAPCPLLKDGACTVYDMRPFACRSLFSPDASACEAGFASTAPALVPSLDWPRFLACGYITGEIAALDDLGLASHLVELRGALALLLADPQALPRWLNGADIFQRLAPR
jgi:hypothetical protein